MLQAATCSVLSLVQPLTASAALRVDETRPADERRNPARECVPACLFFARPSPFDRLLSLWFGSVESGSQIHFDETQCTPLAVLPSRPSSCLVMLCFAMA